MPTPWRRGLYKEIERLDLSGKVLDLGGSRKSGYHELIKGTHTIEVANLDESSGLNIKCDLEKPFPITDSSYDSLLAFNVIEHIFNYQGFFMECHRVLKSKGQLIIGVPFLMHVHPSPHDYWRYTEETLRKILEIAKFNNITITPVGNGLLTASVQHLSGILRFAPIRVVLEYTAKFLDAILSLFSPREKLKKMYPMGYFVIAHK